MEFDLYLAIRELYDAAKKRNMHDNEMSTETAEAVSYAYDKGEENDEMEQFGGAV